MNLCPCGSNKQYEQCCGLYISKQAVPSHAEALMRSRYTAYTHANIDYILSTMRGPALKNFDKNDALIWAKQAKWLRLEVLNSQQDEKAATVEFKAHYSINGQEQVIHEISEFKKIKGQWYYITGNVDMQSQGRNQLCACGSGKKFKRCCG